MSGKIDISFPTEKHFRYVQYITDFCFRHNESLLLKGSLAAGTAKVYSDIDIVVVEKDNKLIERLVAGYRRIVMSNFTERPKGILIVVYDDGLCVDIDVRNSISRMELESCIVLNDCSI